MNSQRKDPSNLDTIILQFGTGQNFTREFRKMLRKPLKSVGFYPGRKEIIRR